MKTRFARLAERFMHLNKVEKELRSMIHRMDGLCQCKDKPVEMILLDEALIMDTHIYHDAWHKRSGHGTISTHWLPDTHWHRDILSVDDIVVTGVHTTTHPRVTEEVVVSERRIGGGGVHYGAKHVVKEEHDVTTYRDGMKTSHTDDIVETTRTGRGTVTQ